MFIVIYKCVKRYVPNKMKANVSLYELNSLKQNENRRACGLVIGITVVGVSLD